MTDATPEQTTEDASSEEAKPADQPDELGDAGKQALDRMKAERNEAQKRAKSLESEIEKQRQASMTEAEKAVAEAEARGRTSASAEFAKRLARTEFDALAGRRNADFDSAGALDLIDLSRFVGEDGEPDSKAIAAAVERLVPQPTNAPPSFDGGSRSTAPATTGMNDLLRKAAGRA